MNGSQFPQRIVCLTEETTEVLYLLGEDWRIVGVSGFTARPPAARLKPKVSAFTTAKFDRILELAVARLASAEDRGQSLVDELRQSLRSIAESAERFPRRPRVFFEEWNEPLISGIRWVDELIEIAGGVPVFPELRSRHDAKDRIVDPREVRLRDPEIVVASWCGRKVTKAAIRSRPGWSTIQHIYEVKSTFILQPGPAALTEGVRQLHAIFSHAVGCPLAPDLQPAERTDPVLPPR